MVMPSPLLEAKLFIPRVRRGLVTRLRLSERLSRRGESKPVSYTHLTLPTNREV